MAIPPLLAESTWVGSAMFALGCAMLTGILLRRTYRHLRKRKQKGGSGPHIAAQPRPNKPWEGAKQDADARFNRQQVELHEMARDLTGKIDSKLILFRELVAQSQQQIERLESLLREADANAVNANKEEEGR